MRETGRPGGKSMAQRIEHITVCSRLHHSFTLSLNSSLSQPGHEIRRDCMDRTQMLTQGFKEMQESSIKRTDESSEKEM